jgi:hypothetical protein
MTQPESLNKPSILSRAACSGFWFGRMRGRLLGDIWLCVMDQGRPGEWAVDQFVSRLGFFAGHFVKPEQGSSLTPT